MNACDLNKAEFFLKELLFLRNNGNSPAYVNQFGLFTDEDIIKCKRRVNNSSLPITKKSCLVTLLASPRTTGQQKCARLCNALRSKSKTYNTVYLHVRCSCQIHNLAKEYKIKSCMSLFTCASIRAIHLELTRGLQLIDLQSFFVSISKICKQERTSCNYSVLLYKRLKFRAKEERKVRKESSE